MRSVEIGLREFSRHVKTPIRKGKVEYLDWGKIIDKTSRRVNGLIALPNSKKKSVDLEFYSGILVELNYFKKFRNDTMHTRRRHTEHSAMDLYLRVRAFMQGLSGRVKEGR
jgi:hypothetical protein